MIKTLLIAGGLLAVTAGLSCAAPEVGKAAPNFSLPDTDGKTRSLADFKGKYVVLEWYQPDCPFVRKHYRSGNINATRRPAAGAPGGGVCEATRGKKVLLALSPNEVDAAIAERNFATRGQVLRELPRFLQAKQRGVGGFVLRLILARRLLDTM